MAGAMDQVRQLEICVDSPEGLAVAAGSSAERIELCAGLALGGLTPSPGLIGLAAGCRVPCHAMVRPVAGDFILRRDGFAAILDDIAAIGDAGLAGIVTGVLTADRELDRQAMSQIIARAGAMEVTLHRAFDLCYDPFAALDMAVDLGVTRILTSGGAPSAERGIARIADLCRYAAGRIQIMAGGGVNATNAAGLLDAGVDSLHASCSEANMSQQDCTAIGISARPMTCAQSILELKRAMTRWGQGGPAPGQVT